MFRLITLDVGGARTAWDKFNHSGYGIMFVDGGTAGFVLRVAFHGNELTESAVYLERGGLLHLPDGFMFDRFFLQHVADAGTVTLAILERPSKDKPIYQRGGFRASPASPLPVSLPADPLPVVQKLDPLPVKSEESITFGTIANPSPGGISAYHTGFNRCRLSRISFDFATDSTVANRRIRLEIYDAMPDLVFQVWCDNTQVASLSAIYIFARDLNVDYLSNYYSNTPLPNCELESGWQFRINCSQIQSGDQISNITFSLVDVLQ